MVLTTTIKTNKYGSNNNNKNKTNMAPTTTIKTNKYGSNNNHQNKQIWHQQQSKQTNIVLTTTKTKTIVITTTAKTKNIVLKQQPKHRLWF